VRGVLPAIVDCGEESEQGGRISVQCGFCTRGKSCGIDSGRRVALTGEGAVREYVCHSTGVVVSGPFILFLFHNHIIYIKKSFSGDVNYEANFLFLFLK
jgi:hypothetical protein